MSLQKLSFTEKNKNEILRGEWLWDDDMDRFNHILRNYSTYKPVETWRVQLLDTVQPIPTNERHIQFLYSSLSKDHNANDNWLLYARGHWVCSYYDRKNIFIYDSLNNKRLEKDHEQFLKKLFPSYDFVQNPVKFPTVQQQPNGSDCGVFTIAFAVSLLFNIKPDKVRYDHSLMRPHLINMFESGVIEHFPQDLNFGVPQKVLTLRELKARDDNATRMRIIRQRKVKQLESSLLQINSDFQHSEEELNSNFSVKRRQKNMIGSLEQKNIIAEGRWLNDLHMDHFNYLLRSCSDYKPVGTYLVQSMDRVQPVSKNKKHIQILPSLSLGTHWTCGYYDTKNIFIYDSLNTKMLSKCQE